MKNSKKIMIGSALILALSVSTITNISYADEAIDVEKKSEQVTKENQLDEDKLIDENEKKENENIEEISEENKINDEILNDEKNNPSDEANDQILSAEENNPSDEANLETDDNADLKENSSLVKMSKKSDESSEQYSRVDENSYKDINEDGNINFNKEEYDKAKEYEKSDEYQRSEPYSKVQNIKSIEENKRIEKFDENLNIGFANGTITKNSASVLRDFVKFNYKNDKAYFDDLNNRRFNISFDTKNFDPSKAGEYKIKVSVLSYTYRHSGFDIRLGHLVENFIRVKVVDDGNDRVFYDTFDKTFKAAEDALKKENRLNEFTVRKSPENSKYFYTLSYDSSKDDPEYTPGEDSKEEIDSWYKDYNETRDFLENVEKNGFQDLNKYDENSQALIRHFLDSKFSSKYGFLTRDEFEKSIPYQLVGPNVNFYKNFYYSIANKVKLLAQYDFKNKKANKKVKLNDRNFITIYNADLEKGNKLPIIKDLVDFKDLKDNLHVNYNWDPETIDTNKLGKQTLKVKFTYLIPGVGEKEFTDNIIINIVDSKNSSENTNTSSQENNTDTKEKPTENDEKPTENENKDSKDDKKSSDFGTKTTDDKKQHFELSKKDDDKVKTANVQKNNNKNIINKENKPSRQAKSNNVETGIASLSSVLSLLATSFLGFILSKKNK
ncbi:hypothetical protein [Anaerococcus ihuae]|uniref:hypothetical protein n=1 Tax=Anaerococcus ihuae TaxID=2899519 RepID=UPI001F2269D4|nr:hypothetical protein [Anaerococcus ihuae]